MKTPTLLAVAALAAFSVNLARADGAASWKSNNCSSCHGADGAGHTKAGRMKGVKDMTDAAYQAGFTDEQAFKQIKSGQKTADGAEKMKAYGDKLSDDEIKGLVAYVRAFKK